MNKKLAASVVVLSCISTAAHAGSVGVGYVTGMFTNKYTGNLIFTHNGTRSGTPTCASSYPGRWAIDLSTATGQTAASVVMSAYSLNRTVTVTGTGLCTPQTDTEGVDIVNMPG